MKIIYLIPPSEGKNTGGEIHKQTKRGFKYVLPLEIAKHASSKDLKCKDTRYKQAIELNTEILNSPLLPAIERYTGVMYSAIGYNSLSQQAQTYFDDHVLILSALYGIVKPTDMIGNYKLPIETKGLLNFWGDEITHTLNNMKCDIIVDLLPNSYKKMIDWKKIKSKILRVDFYQQKDKELKKMSHGVKKIKGEYLKNISTQQGIEGVENYREKENTLQVIHTL